MSCLHNGQSSSLPRQFHLTAYCAVGLGQTIALSQWLKITTRMLQMTVHWGAVPALTGDLTLEKTASADARLNTVYRRVDPSSATGQSLTDFVCVTPFIWNDGDLVVINYANPSNLDVGVEIFLEEVMGRY
jgi:hypothetical protein